MLTIKKALFARSSMRTLDTELATLRKSKKYVPKYQLINSDTHVGLEIEVERILRTSPIFGVGESFVWNNIEDGSLRNSGREFVSVPLKGDDISLALDVLSEHFKKDKTCIAHEFTDRTSIHVHVNFQDSTIENVYSFILSYLLVEPFLYRFAGGERDKNIFCVPLCESNLSYDLGLGLDYLKTNDENTALGVLKNWQKYTGLNLLPIFKYGTIEFRHLVGTEDLEKIHQWLNIIFSIKNFSEKYSLDKIISIISQINTTSDYIQRTEEIMGSIIYNIDMSDINQVLEKTSASIKDALSTYKNSKKISNQIHEKSLAEVNPLFCSVGSFLGVLRTIGTEQKIKDLNSLAKKLRLSILDLKNTVEYTQSILGDKDLSPEVKEYWTTLNISNSLKIKECEKQLHETKSKIKKLSKNSTVNNLLDF